MDYDDYESLPTTNFVTHMTAGAIAGVLEHCVMYPLDSVKTRMQSLSHSPGHSIIQIFQHMVKQEGILRPMRGLSAVVMGAGPAHAFYFASYEYSKETLSRLTHHKYNQICYGAAGCVATIIHDGISNPTEVVKQRLQMYNSPYKSVIECIKKVYAQEGLRAFYRSYTTQLFMNIPFHGIFFMSYEYMQKRTNPDRKYNPLAHMTSGAMAGAIAAAATTPLDVCKTLLNTEGKSRGLIGAIRHVHTLAGPWGYFRGMQARVLYQMPAAAICWSTYEFFKYILSQNNDLNPSPPKSKPSDFGSHSIPLDKDIISDKLHLRLVLPQASVSAENTTDLLSERSINDSSVSSGVRLGDHNESIGLKTCELPAVSGANLYGALNFNTVHTENNASSTRIGSNKVLDYRHS